MYRDRIFITSKKCRSQNKIKFLILELIFLVFYKVENRGMYVLSREGQFNTVLVRLTQALN